MTSPGAAAPPALRTRSKYPMNEVSLELLENEFQPPDDIVFPDTLDPPYMHSPHPDEQHWVDFLAALPKTGKLPE